MSTAADDDDDGVPQTPPCTPAHGPMNASGGGGGAKSALRHGGRPMPVAQLGGKVDERGSAAVSLVRSALELARDVETVFPSLVARGRLSVPSPLARSRHCLSLASSTWSILSTPPF